MRGTLNVEDLIAELRIGEPQDTPKLSLAAIREIEAAPVKLAGRLESLYRKGFPDKARVHLAHGDNPFPESGAKHMRVIADMLLRGPITRAELRDEYIRQFGWSRATASSEVSNAIALMKGMGLVELQGEQLTLPDF